MTPSELKEILNSQIESVASYLLPDGEKKGSEWCVGSVDGGKGKSLKVKLNGGKVGVWTDFANPEYKGDILDLWQSVRNISFVDVLKEAKSFVGVVDIKPEPFEHKVYKKPEKPVCKKPQSDLTQWLSKRNISVETLEKFKIGQKDNAVVFPFISPDGNLELIKYRKINTKEIWSNKDPIPCLFGWQSISDNSKRVVICEGEIDAMSWYQSGFDALSLPFGGGNGKKQDWIGYEFERLERFEEIYLSMDMDDAGNKALSDIIDRLGVHRCRIVKLPFKDANECLEKPDGKDILINAIDNAKTKDPVELRNILDFHDGIVNEFSYSSQEEKGMRLPFHKVGNDLIFRPSDITIWAGINGHGKSVLLSNIAVDGMSKGERFCFASMEMKPVKIGKQVYKQLSGMDKPNDLMFEKIKESFYDRMWLFEAYGTAKADRILEVFDYARRRYKVTQFVVDSLAKCGFAEDGYNDQKAFVDRLMEFARQHNVHVHLVVHIRKLKDEKEIPGKFDLKGTGAISDMVDNVVIVWRNKPKEDDRDNVEFLYKPDTVLKCVKQRETGKEPKIGLWFNSNTCLFRGADNDPPVKYI